MEFKDISDNYRGKMLRAFITIDDDHVTEVNLYYSNQVIHEKNQYGVSVPNYTGYQDIKLNVTKMVRTPNDVLVGGLGQTKTVMSDIKRKTIKALWDYSKTLSVNDVLAIAEPQTTKPSRVI